MKKLGDRNDAKRVRGLDGLSQILLDLKPRRCDSDVYINQKIDVTNLVKYMEKRKKDNSDLSYFHAFVTAIGKTYYNRPKLNRFVANRHIFEHNSVVISFVAKVSFDDSSEEVMVMVDIKSHDTIDTISKQIKDKIEKIRNKSLKKEGANNAIDIFGKMPNIIRIPLVGGFKLLDKFGLLPKSLVKDNIYYSSLIVSNLGSIKCGAIYHNITNFGTCSGLLTMGEIKDEEVLIDGKKQIRKICEFGVNLDERIADGYYFVKSVKLLEYILEHPETLEEEMNKIINVEEVR
ncbi:MAG: 2-oxo acid dehydrogenase subunit E2 [bacterium]|nr:2-oxo acid dehydrogenase subunit E2 [bacterium]